MGQDNIKCSAWTTDELEFFMGKKNHEFKFKVQGILVISEALPS